MLLNVCVPTLPPPKKHHARWTANWARQGPMTTVIFVTLEGLRHGFGMDGI